MYSLCDRIDDFIHLAIFDHDLNFDLGDEVQGIGTSPIVIVLALLAAISSNLLCAQSMNSNGDQGVSHRFERLDSNVGLHAFHGPKSTALKPF